ncbi:hypothetical protein T439DRAFT_334609 [Meredithblackwellia eburnea MCA 4105]
MTPLELAKRPRSGNTCSNVCLTSKGARTLPASHENDVHVKAWRSRSKLGASFPKTERSFGFRMNPFQNQETLSLVRGWHGCMVVIRGASWETRAKQASKREQTGPFKAPIKEYSSTFKSDQGEPHHFLVTFKKNQSTPASFSTHHPEEDRLRGVMKLLSPVRSSGRKRKKTFRALEAEGDGNSSETELRCQPSWAPGLDEAGLGWTE